MNLREQYLHFFKEKNHTVYESLPLVPDDPSLLFTNAGMVQFKDIFTGKIPRPTPPRATSSQLCIRAGGKHNDLENVGYTARHHTLFEMLGNFSFGDYFKREAIAFAWEFVTKDLAFKPEVLYVSIHESDDEAFKLWCEHIDPSRIKRLGDKDNFWQMGDVGPCGPCSEIYVDQGDKYFKSKEDYFGGDGDRFLEIWNLVFMQYEQKDGQRQPLPSPSIDTGLGLERVVALKEGRLNNFDTSLFAPLMQKIEELTSKSYYRDDEILSGTIKGEAKAIRANQASFRVLADHARSVALLLAQGVSPDKEGRGYVLRRILRRALRHGYFLGLREPFLFEILGAVCKSMGGAYGYLLEREAAIKAQCRLEEERFLETLESGLDLFNTELARHTDKTKRFSGEVAFRLYDTYGFPLDLTQDLLRNRGLTVDLGGFEALMEEQKQRSKISWKGSGEALKEGDFHSLLSEFGKNDFVGYEGLESKARLLALLDSKLKRTDSLEKGEVGYVLLDKTPFYPESGGPVGDRGHLLSLEGAALAVVIDSQKYFNLNLSKIQALAGLKPGLDLVAKVDPCRLEIAKHHSATHLLHFALRSVLGTHLAQAGSLVEPHRLRFDFSHPRPLSPQELAQVEELVNKQILESAPQVCEQLGLEEAKSKGALALFGEKYEERVRVISFGSSIELCGGIHVANTAEIGSFYITKETGVSSGVRRIEAVCGQAAYRQGKQALAELEEARGLLKTQNLLQGLEKLKAQLSDYKQKASKPSMGLELDYEEVGGVKLAVLRLDCAPSEAKAIVDEFKNKHERAAILLLVAAEGKVSLVAGVKGASLHAGDWAKKTALVLGGSGGGRADFASAGGKEIDSIPKALELAKTLAREGLA